MNELIGCPKFGGSRQPSSCIVMDRYRTCRKGCAALAEYLKNNPGATEKSIKEYKERSIYQPELFSLSAMKFAGKGLVNPRLKCPKCKFSAASERGLKSHLTRQHK